MKVEQLIEVAVIDYLKTVKEFISLMVFSM